MSLKLVILGLLMEKEMHPYEIRQLMKERSMHHYMKLQDGSLYYAVDQLKKDGFIDVVEIIREPHRPDKTIYRITKRGHELFQELLLQQFSLNKVIENPLYTALPFAGYGEQTQIAELLECKVAEAEERVAKMRGVYEEHRTFVPRSALHLMSGMYGHAVTELKWLRRLLRDAKEERLAETGAFWELDSEE